MRDAATAGAACGHAWRRCGRPCCSGSGAALAGTATVPGGATALWALHAKIDPATTQDTADVDVTATYTAPWSDSDTLVIFRDGFGN